MSDNFYHIASKVKYPWMQSDPLMVGTSITTEGVNPFFNYFLEHPEPGVNVTVDGVVENWTRMTYLWELSQNRVNTSLSIQRIAALGQDAAMHYCKYLRELIWENVRSSEFPEKPSRQRCIWLAEGEDNLKYWLPRIPASAETHRIFRVKPKGMFHYASDEHLMKDAELYPESLEKARKYWRGDIAQKCAQEILFEGTLDIIEEVDLFS
jgi:hypothetical protein